jgi:O-antigen ligase
MVVVSKPSTAVVAPSMAMVVLALAAIASVIVLPLESQFPAAFPKVALLAFAAAVALIWGGSRFAFQSDESGVHAAEVFTNPFGVVALCFLAALAVNVLFSTQSVVALWGASGRNNGAVLYGSLTVVGLTLFSGDRPVRASQLHSAHLVCIAVTVLYGAAQQLGHDPVHWTSQGPISVFGNLDQAGSWFGMSSVSAAVAVAQRERRVWQRLAAAVLAVLAVWLVVVVYRAPWRIDQAAIILTVGVALWCLPYIRRLPTEPWTKWALPLLGVVVAGGLVWLALQVFPSNGAVHRGQIWLSVLRLFRGAPITGIGFGRLEYPYFSVRSDLEARSFGSETFVDDAHSVPLQILVSGGLLVGIPYLLLAGLAVRRSLSNIWSAAHGMQSSLRLLSVLTVLYWCQATMSPEMPGMAIWGWLMSAAVVFAVPDASGVAMNAEEESASATSVRRYRRPVGWLLLLLGAGHLFITADQVWTEVRVTRLTQWAGTGSRSGHSTVSLVATARERRGDVAAIMRKRPGDVRIGLLMSRVLKEGRDYLGVITIDSVVLVHEPQSTAVRIDLAEAYRSVRRPDLALLQIERVLKDAPRTPRYLLFAAHAAADAHDSTKAVAMMVRGDALNREMGLRESSYEALRDIIVRDFKYLDIAREAEPAVPTKPD